jgi:hypothetical protein
MKVVTLHILIIGKWIIKDGEENRHKPRNQETQVQWNVMNKPYIVLLKRIWPWVVLLIFHGPP